MHIYNILLLLLLFVTLPIKGSVFYSDHLGSAHWITERHGDPIQYIHYLPYGEILANQHTTYNERFKFTGKELDGESGYYYFGARYLLSELGDFLSVDPLSDKTPSIQPYLYCNGNPIKFVDPDGTDIYNIDENNGNIEVIKTEGDTHYYYLKNGDQSSFVGTFQQNTNGLIQIPENMSFMNANGVECGISVKEGQLNKSYINPDALASLIGAVGSLGYSDVMVTQFSTSDGASPAPSRSHVNGVNGDLRYLRTDGISAATNVGSSKFDFVRNESLTAALYKFGWHDMISEFSNTYLLPFTSAASTRGITTNHSNHLHLQRYNPQILETYKYNLPEIVIYGR